MKKSLRTRVTIRFSSPWPKERKRCRRVLKAARRPPPKPLKS
ncbi:MAG: hypothetical protein FDX21_08990 [Chlorobium sp.]|nr:MAG: hypothetical protein FDX21_08990 [Chlorobium sp.]